MPSVAWDVKTPLPFSLKLTVFSHGWIHLGPFAWVDGALVRREELPDGTTVVDVGVRQVADGTLAITAASESLDESDQEALTNKVRRWLGFDLDLAPVFSLAERLDPDVHALLLAGGGRFLRGSSLFEDAVKTLFTTNASWSFTERMVENLLRLGREGAFPQAAALRAYDEAYYREHLRVGNRGRYLEQMVELFSRGLSDEEILAGRIPGLGDYGHSHLRFLTWDFSRIPIDSEVRKYMSTHHGIRTDEEIRAAFAPWREYALLGYILQRQARRYDRTGD
jgi:N-glycosylase/DNA lyase